MTSRSISNYLVIATAFLLFSVTSAGNDAKSPDIQVELSSQRPLSLQVTVWSRAESRVTLAKWRLPWGNQRTMLFVPVNPLGERIGNKYVDEEYPDYRKVSIDPNSTISGKIDLEKVIPELREALRKSDVHLFWAYEAPEELRIAHWSGGWILIPQEK